MWHIADRPAGGANVVKVIVEKFDIKSIGTVEEDIEAKMAGK